MEPKDFCYWLQGYLEISALEVNGTNEAPKLNALQIKVIQEHLALVLRKVTGVTRPYSDGRTGPNGPTGPTC